MDWSPKSRLIPLAPSIRLLLPAFYHYDPLFTLFISPSNKIQTKSGRGRVPIVAIVQFLVFIYCMYMCMDVCVFVYIASFVVAVVSKLTCLSGGNVSSKRASIQWDLHRNWK